MNTHHIKTAFLTAIIGVGLASQSAKAVITYADDDLMMGFRDASGSVTSTLLINLGQAGFYRDQTTNIFGLSIGSIDTDLKAVFGNTWATNATTLSNLQWGLVGRTQSSLGVLFGSTTDGINTLYASKPEITYGTKVTGYARAASGTQGTPGAKITNMGNEINNNTSGWTAGSNPNAIIEPTSGNSLNWAFFNPGSSSFSYFTGLQGSFANGVSSTALDLFRMPTGSGTGTYEGTFTLTSAGVLNYGANGPAIAAAPEPSRAMLTLFGAAFIAMRRRRKVTAA